MRRIGERNLTRLVAVALLVLGVSAAGCGGGVSSNSVTRSSSSTTGGGSTNAASASADFGWLRPGPAPADWRSAQISTGAVLYYPPTWRQSVSDPGTASAALHDQRDRFLGYLNLTPRQGNESLSNWGSFRVEHNADEGDRRITTLAVGRNLSFRSGHGACVRDSYATRTGNHFEEIACLVAGRKATSVIVGAAPPDLWASNGPAIERAISAFTT